MAQQLKAAGLRWQPTLNDFFAVPDVGLDERLFVLGDMMATLEVRDGWPAITFNGVVEWALDYVLAMDALWMPTETQIRDLLAAQLTPNAELTLTRSPAGYTCRIGRPTDPEEYSTDRAADAYARALLACLG